MERTSPMTFGFVGRCRRFFDLVIGAEASGSMQEIQAARLRLFMGLAILSSGFYICHDYQHQSYWTAGLHSLALASLCAGIVLLRDLGRLKLVSHLATSVLTLLLGFIPLWDGHIHAPGLWAAVLVVMAAPFLFRSRTVIRYAGGTAGMVLLNWGLGPYFDHLEPVTQLDEQWFQLRLITLVALSGLIVIGGASSLRSTRRILANTKALLARAQEENVAQRSKSVFLATMAYELQMPMKGLARLAERMRLGISDASFQQSVDRLCGSTSRLVSMLDAVSDLASLEAGTVELSESPFTMGGVLDELHKQFSPQAKAKGLSLRVSDGLGPKQLQGDIARIYQVLASLVENSIKFSDSGQIQVCATRESRSVQEAQALESVVIRVHDQGIGMNEAQLERIFGHFEQVHEEEQRQRGGCGLGLSVSQRLVRLMGGTLEVESQEGQGSTFTCRLNLASARLGLDDTELSSVLGLEFLGSTLEDTPILTREAQPVSENYDAEPGRFFSVVAPVIFVFMVRALVGEDHVVALLHAICLAGVMGSVTKACGRRLGPGVWVPFVFCLSLSIVLQSFFDGDIHSEALWCVALPPIIAAYVFGLRWALVAVCGAAVLILCIGSGVSDSGSFELGQDSVLFTLAVRFSFILACVGTTVLITRGSRARLTAMREHQASVRKVSLAAERANLEKTRFFVRISEEIGAPLRTLLDVAGSRAIRRSILPQDLCMLDRMERSARAIFRLLDRALLHAGAEPAQDVDPREAFDFHEALLDVRCLFLDESQARGVELVIEGSNAPRWCVGDGARVLEILTLLVSYALSSAQREPIVLSVKDGEDPSPETRAVTVRLQSRAEARDEVLSSQLQMQRDSAWSRAVQTAQQLGGELRILETPSQSRWIELSLVFAAPPMGTASAA